MRERENGEGLSIAPCLTTGWIPTLAKLARLTRSVRHKSRRATVYGHENRQCQEDGERLWSLLFLISPGAWPLLPVPLASSGG